MEDAELISIFVSVSTSEQRESLIKELESLDDPDYFEFLQSLSAII